MARALGQDPAGVFAAPYDHAQINDAVGGPNDVAGETAAIMSFVAAAVEASQTPRARLPKRPRKRVASTGRLTEVRFKLASSTPGATFECRIDSRRLRPCASKRTVRLRRGPHRLRYRAIGSRGRPGNGKSYRFRVVARR
jgi:hypothetical protein